VSGSNPVIQRRVALIEFSQPDSRNKLEEASFTTHYGSEARM
jgi:hypothetical protein